MRAACPLGQKKLARGALAGGHEAALREVEKLDFDPHQLDCLLNPKRYAPIWRRLGKWGGFAMLHQVQGGYYVKGFGKHEDSDIRGKAHDDALMVHDFSNVILDFYKNRSEQAVQQSKS